MAGWASKKAKASFHQACENLRDALVHLQQVQDGLQRTLKRPGTVRLDIPDKRRVSDGRREAVLFSVFVTWGEAGRPLTYTTEPLSSNRVGPLIEFTNAVVRCVTEPSKPLPPRMIQKELKALLDFLGEESRPRLTVRRQVP